MPSFGTTRDKLSFGAHDPERVRLAAYRVISRTQDDPATQVIGTATALIALCSALDIDIRQLLTSVERRRDDLDGPFVYTFRAIEEYARNEIGRR